MTFAFPAIISLRAESGAIVAYTVGDVDLIGEFTRFINSDLAHTLDISGAP